MPSLHDLLASYRAQSVTEREKGAYFEDLVKVYFENDDIQRSQYDQVWTFREWAKEHDRDGKDTGIDLVARMADGSGYCAIQCKFYKRDHHVQKGEIDSFFTASGKEPFTRRIIVDSTEAPYSKNAEDALQGQQITTTRIGLTQLEESRVEWEKYLATKEVVLRSKKTPRPHQIEACEVIRERFKEHDRGKLIMACGTGKTYTGLCLMEEHAGKGKLGLFLVPSLALMAQTVTEWKNDAVEDFRAFAVCSDTQVGKRKIKDDVADINVHDLVIPATTDARKLAEKTAKLPSDEMTVIFATYQSIQVLNDAQQLGLPDFDLIICDEAHRTTGATLAGEDETKFVKVHDNGFIKAKKRLYMTATPRIFGDEVKSKAKQVDAVLASMDDEALFGPVFFKKGFGWAVENGLLSDYKVIVLAVDEAMVSRTVQNRLKDGAELKLDDATKIIGCYKALTKENLIDDKAGDKNPMRRALAFCKDIKSSKLIVDEFEKVVDDYLSTLAEEEGVEADKLLLCDAAHVDGTFNAKERGELLSWLKADTEANNCRILSNARCLSEGVDVPSLDAIMFLHPRKSQVDVVQSVGRVMRRAEGKKLGYVILPVGIPPDVEPAEALNNNEKYKVVWQILNALRAHDERFNATINKASLGEDITKSIEVVPVIDRLPEKKRAALKSDIGSGSSGDDSRADGDSVSMDLPIEEQLGFVFDEFTKALLARIVKKCGTRDYWEDWAADIAKIAQTHITRITTIVEKEGSAQRKAFEGFLAELRDDLNPEISPSDAIEMLAQHIITKPVFDALFTGHAFTRENPVSKAINVVLEALEEQNLEKESESLTKFYKSVERRAEGIETAQGRQKLVVQLYDKFFQKAFPKVRDKLGIVYTPVEVVDFILHSVNDVLQAEFGQTLGSKGVHIIDPFTGTGTFITRLLQSGLIKPEELEHKYLNEIHANEIVLLAYYIAAINIEAVYHETAEEQGIHKKGIYKPFEGICLTDTFQLYEQQQDMIADLMPDNSERRTRQKELDIRVIVGNPPYSAGQKNANDNAANVKYEGLDRRIGETYAAHSSATNKNALYDSYIRAVRWASDRIQDTGVDAGVVAYVSNAGWVDGNAMDGLRKCLKEEFSSLYVFHLRGNQRTSGELSRQEGGKIFGSGSRAPIAVSVLVRNPDAAKHGKIFFHDIGDYLSREEKLQIVSNFGSLNSISERELWKTIEPDEQHDWLNLRDKSFENYPVLGDKKNKQALVLFENYSSGVKSQRDAWCYNGSKAALETQVESTIAFYCSELERYDAAGKPKDIDEFLNFDATQISWTSALKSDVEKGKELTFRPEATTQSVYRPFQKQWLYFDRRLNERVYQMPYIFPESSVTNRVIVVEGSWRQNGNLAMMSNSIHALMPDGGCQCFPLKLYERSDEGAQGDIFASNEGSHKVRDGFTDEGLRYYQEAYPEEHITKEDLFYYIYGLLYSPEYRERFKNNLSKELPRIPAVSRAEDFWAFSKAGRALGELHVNYESVEPYPVIFKEGSLELANITDEEAFFRVEKMKFGKKQAKDEDGKSKKVDDKSTVTYNAHITMTGIPEEAYDYVVNGKPALAWVMERQCVKIDKDSGIVNDANRYAIETVGNPRYPLELFQRVITVSLETMKIVNALPKLEIMEEATAAASEPA
ncbi:DEAD/DEAH box helicase [Pseudovibrio brasiliensis]|uniref:DEAD/DEAH box helicase n=1 Tax=Pseudovibrio brasiliensis TaxID=1898042 RepID=A0ABX8AMA3_9HYPH|nr:type ISP restriction/modification enzyme [Pseudovibrio brasiliensis]QUS55397.1 DEAD/DEAH box helicase [Pseudovibrio brasiliensis]